jgi:hypothetical protein
MTAWLDTETRALLHRSPPDKLAPPDTATFALVLLSSSGSDVARLYTAVWRVRRVSEEGVWAVLLRPRPTTLQTGLSLEDSLLGQFELISCDAVSVFLADDVLAGAPAGYLEDLYARLLRSSEFETVPIRIEEIPPTAQGLEFLERFLGQDGPRPPSVLRVMRKKARIMEHWANKIGGRLVVG